MSYTLVITSCDRHDLLRRTIDSFIACADMKPVETVIVEDSVVAAPPWYVENRAYYASRLGKVTWVGNDCRMGQVWSIDRAYQLVNTEFIFHCEDDWEFREIDFVRESIEILKKYPEVGQVSLRGDTGWHQLIDLAPYPFKIAMPYWKGPWGGLSWNPGIRRMADYQRIGSFGLHTSYGTSGLGHEALLSKMLLDQGYRIADLDRPIVEHIGCGRSRAVEKIEWQLPKVLIAVPACHAYEYGKWESESSPRFDLSKAYNGKPYGTDIHISGEGGERISALRQTWVRDAAAFESLDVKFFYGAPHQGSPQADEVFLGCPDDYEHLPHKTVAICQWAVENGYDYMLKVDDDTAVYVDRAVRELMSNRFDYAGCCHQAVCTGGPGYWLSKRAMKEVARNGVQDHWAEDVTVCKIMTNANIYPVNLPGHKSGLSQHWFFGNTFDSTKLLPDMVSFHAVQPEVMKEWYRHAHPAAA